MATHSSFLVWEIPRTEEPGKLQSMGLQRVGHNQSMDRIIYSVGTLGTTKVNKTDSLYLHAFQVSGTCRCIGNYRTIMQ